MMSTTKVAIYIGRENITVSFHLPTGHMDQHMVVVILASCWHCAQNSVQNTEMNANMKSKLVATRIRVMARCMQLRIYSSITNKNVIL